MKRDSTATEELVDVRRAAERVGRHPETVRRWVWSGRLPAQKRGNKLLISIADLEALVASQRRHTSLSLAAWAKRARCARLADQRIRRRRSAADLIIDDRKRRSEADARR